MGRRIHVLGASGTGTSTLARALATQLDSQSFDTDDFFWYPSDPPFTDERPVSDRLRLMQELFLPRGDWILAGSVLGWGAPIVPRLSHVVFLTLDPAARLARLAAREAARYGTKIAPGGSRREASEAFLAWAAGYDDDAFPGRSRRKHEAWLKELSCPVIRLDAAPQPAELARLAAAALDRAASGA